MNEEEIVKRIESGTLDYRQELVDFIMDISKDILKIDTIRKRKIETLENVIKHLSNRILTLEEKISKQLYIDDSY